MARKIPNIVKRIQNNPPPEINYAFQKHVSYSQMSIYKQCPHRWKLQYKDKIKRFTSSIHTVFGTAIHETLQDYLQVMYDQSAAEADRIEIEELFKVALEQNPEVRAAKYGFSAAKHNANVSKAALSPKVTLNFDISEENYKSSNF